jgi:hypothetical protein
MTTTGFWMGAPPCPSISRAAFTTVTVFAAGA